MKIKGKDIVMSNKVFKWIALGTVLILSIPLIAMQFKDDVVWTLSDFVAMGILLFGAGSIFVAVARVTPRKFRVLIGVAVLAAFLLVWTHLAVGIVDSWPLAVF